MGVIHFPYQCVLFTFAIINPISSSWKGIIIIIIIVKAVFISSYKDKDKVTMMK